jgi:hypothetical protein
MVGVARWRLPAPGHEHYFMSHHLLDPPRGDVEAVRGMMLRAHYFEEANWLGLAISAPQACRSEGGRAALAEARIIAAQFGFPRLSRWVAELLVSTDAGFLAESTVDRT